MKSMVSALVDSSRMWIGVGVTCVVLGAPGTIATGQVATVGKSPGAVFPVRKLPDTGQQTSYTSTFGEDADYTSNPASLAIKGNGTIADNVTGLMWQQEDGGEMTFERAATYCDTLTLAGFDDWRLPTSHELFGILHHDRLNPALDTLVFTKTLAEYWWSADRRVGDTARIWVTNAGGGIGPHPRTETLSAGGTKRIHVRAVRTQADATVLSSRFRDNGDSTVTDLSTGLTWQRFPPSAAMTWESALAYCESADLGGAKDWRLPNLKELHSLNDETLSNPSVDRIAIPAFPVGRIWSSTTQVNSPTRAWYLDTQYGIVTYELKTATLNVLCVRGGLFTPADTIGDVLLPGGEFAMGDHYGFVDPSHPSDELPIHTVKVNAFFAARTEATNALCCSLLNAARAAGLLEVRGDCVFLPSGSDTLLYLNGHASYSSIGWNGTAFSVVDFRAQHPIVGIMWKGAAALCNWASQVRGLQECYDTQTWACDFSKSGYRLPTEAEWEFAGRGGEKNPYYNYPWGNDQDVTKANWPGSGDPYESGAYPYTTPAGFYDGTLKQKSQFTWPGSTTSYQTSNGANAFGLYDLAGNVWEFVNDWYGNDYYSKSPFDNPKGPDAGFIMPDGKPYRGMRGGNWYNGYATTGVNDGHSRVSNRNPSYYRGPEDPNHPWYHVGFRMVRSTPVATGVRERETPLPTETRLMQNYPNPFNGSTMITYDLPAMPAGTQAGQAGVSGVGSQGSGGIDVKLVVYDVLGKEIAVLVDEKKVEGRYVASFDAAGRASGVYICRLTAGPWVSSKKMVLCK